MKSLPKSSPVAREQPNAPDLTHNLFLRFVRPNGHREPRNEVESLWLFELETCRF